MRKVMILGAVVILCAGCVPSLHPLYTDLDLRQNSKLPGIWVNDDNTEVWEFSLAADSVSYALIYTDKNDAKHFEAHLLELDGIRYLDTYPSEEINNDFYKIHLVPAHIFGKIEFLSDSLRLSLIDPDWLKDMITKGDIKIAHEQLDGGLVLTAPTGDLQRMIKAHAKDPKAFAEPLVLHRR